MSAHPEYDCLLDLVTRRRSIREFKPDPVPEDYIKKIIDVARWAPSAFHTQPWEFVVITDPEVKQKIVAVLDNKGPAIIDPEKKEQVRPSFRDAPVFILACCDWRVSAGLPGVTGIQPRDKVNNHYVSSMAGAFDFMHVAAVSLGLASQWYTATSRPGVEDAIKEIIGIPDELSIYDMMVLGYPAKEPAAKMIRDVDDMIHWNACGKGDFRTEAEVLAYVEQTRAWCLSEH